MLTQREGVAIARQREASSGRKQAVVPDQVVDQLKKILAAGKTKVEAAREPGKRRPRPYIADRSGPALGNSPAAPRFASFRRRGGSRFCRRPGPCASLILNNRSNATVRTNGRC